MILLIKKNVLNFRENLVDEFTCDGRTYGYYADVANDCQELESV